MNKNIVWRLSSSKLFRSFFVTTIGSGVSKAILILGTFYCTNTLSKVEFGEYSFVRNTLTMILTICALNFSNLCTKFATEATSSSASLKRLFILFCFSLFICTLAGVLLLCMPSQMLYKLMGSNVGLDFFRVAGLLLPIFMLQPLIEGVLRGLMHFRLIGLLQVFSSVFYFVSLFVGINAAGVEGAIWALYLQYAIYSFASLSAIMYIERGKTLSVKGLMKEIGVIPNMILPVFVMSFIEAPVFWYLQVLLTRYSTAEAIASMTVMKQVRNFALLIPNYFFATYIAFAGSMNAKHQYDKYFSQFDRLIFLFGLGGLGIFVLFSLLSKAILFLYGDIYINDWPILVICCIGIPISLVMSLVRQSLILQEHQRELMAISIFWNVIWIALFYIMVLQKIDPLAAFFYSEIIAWGINLCLSYWLYRNDKNKLLYGK